MPTGGRTGARKLRLRRSVSCHGRRKLYDAFGSARSASVTHAQLVLVNRAGAVSGAQDEIWLPCASRTCNRTAAPLNVGRLAGWTKSAKTRTMVKCPAANVTP